MAEMVLHKQQSSVTRIVLRILAIAAVVVAMSIFSLRSCQNKFSRDWEPKTITIGNANLRTALTVDRYHDPNQKGKFGQYDEMKFNLSVEQEAVDQEKAAQFLERECNTHPEIFFVNRDGEPVIEPIHVDLKQDEKTPGTWRATGSMAYPNEMRKARDWFLQFDPNVQ